MLVGTIIARIGSPNQRSINLSAGKSTVISKAKLFKNNVNNKDYNSKCILSLIKNIPKNILGKCSVNVLTLFHHSQVSPSLSSPVFKHIGIRTHVCPLVLFADHNKIRE